MDIRIFTLLILIGILGSFSEARAVFFDHTFRNGGPRDVIPLADFAASSRLKRAVGDSNGETTTTSQATTTTTPSSTPDTTTDPTTTEPPTTTDPPTDPTTTPASTTTEATTPTTEATTPTTEATTPTTEATTPTTEATTPTTEATSPSTTPTTTTGTTPSSTSATTPASTTPESSTTPDSMTPKPEKPTPEDILSRSDFDKPEDSAEKPGPSSKSNKEQPTPGPYYPGFPNTAFPSPFGQFGPGFDPYFGYPGYNSIPGSGPNYAWTGTSGGPGFASAGASAGATTGTIAGGNPGMVTYPIMGYPSAGSPSIGNRGGYQDNSPDLMNTYPGYGAGYGSSGIDPLYNPGTGFYFPGQFPTYNDPSFDMIRQIQAQIEAQHRAFAEHMASLQASIVNQGRPYVENVATYPYVSSNTNNMGVQATYNDAAYQNSYNSHFGYSNMDFHNRLASEAANYDGAQLASASIGIGPNGGFQTGQISPAAPGLESRFAEDLPAPSGNSYGVFASSSSSSMTGPDGKPINHKSSITGVNDNGKISYRTVHD